MCLPRCVVIPPIPHRAISTRKPPPLMSNWKVSKSTCVTWVRLKCGYEPVKPLSRSIGTTDAFNATSISSRGDSIACPAPLVRPAITRCSLLTSTSKHILAQVAPERRVISRDPAEKRNHPAPMQFSTTVLQKAARNSFLPHLLGKQSPGQPLTTPAKRSAAPDVLQSLYLATDLSNS